MNNELVSVICPCYNSEDYIQRMLDSVKNQTYRDIEMICVDDGSMDRTVNIIKRNIKAFESKGMRLLCIQAKHKGQAAAVNTALKIISGDYFTLIDSDDFFLPESIEKRVVALKNNPECAVSASDFYFVNEDDTEKIIGKANGKLGWLPFQKKQFGVYHLLQHCST